MRNFEIEVTLPSDPAQSMAWIESIIILAIDSIAAGNIALEIMAKRFDIAPLKLFVSSAIEIA